MNNWVIKVLVIFIISTSMIVIVSTGLWLLNQPSDMCLGNTTTSGHAEFTSIIYVGAGFSLIIATLYLFFTVPVAVVVGRRSTGGSGGGHEPQQRRVFLAVSCFVLQLVVLILFAGVYALTQSTFGFATLQRWIGSPERWWNIEQCLYMDSQVCALLERRCHGDVAQDQFLARHFTPIEYGCCKPPLDCNFYFSSSTVWIKPENGSYSNKDCDIWDNDPKKLCYNCQQCKLGYTLELKRVWTISGLVVIITLLIFLSAFILPRVLLSRDLLSYNTL